MQIEATEVFQWNWEASRETCPLCTGLSVSPNGSLVADECTHCKGSKRKYRYLKNKGSSRSSKTHSICQMVYLYAQQNPNRKVAVFRDTKQICKETVWGDMMNIYPNMPGFEGVRIHLTTSVIYFPNGSSIHIEGTDDTLKVHGYQCDVLWLNEPYYISKATFDQLDMRCSDFVIFDLNPVGDHWSDTMEDQENCIVIHSTFLNNPFCPPAQRAKILSYKPVSWCRLVQSEKLTETEAYAYDCIENPKGFTEKEINDLISCKENERVGSASAYNWCVYGLGLKAERPNRIYHWRECTSFDYDSIDAPEYVGCDWGAVDPWAIVKVKYYDGCLYIREMNYKSENEIKASLPPIQLEQIVSNEEGVVKWKFGQLGIDVDSVIICDNNRPQKIRALRSIGYEYSVAAVKGRITDGIDVLNGIVVYYTSDSKNIRYEQENYSRKVDRYGIVGDEPEDRDNHLMDAIRYVAEYLRSNGIIRVV